MSVLSSVVLGLVIQGKVIDTSHLLNHKIGQVTITMNSSTDCKKISNKTIKLDKHTKIKLGKCK